jgi:hypothetical protein
MADLQILATYPGFLVVAALPERIFTRGRTSALPDEPAKRVFFRLRA